VSKDKAKEAEAPQEGVEGEGGAPAKKKPKLMMLIIAGVGALAILGGGGAGAYFMFLKPKPAGEHGEAAKEKKKEKKAEKGAKDGKPQPGDPVIKEGPDGVVFYTLPDILVNLQTSDGRPAHLKLKLTFELPDEEVANDLTPDMPRMNDMFQTFLRELRPEDLSGSQGSYQLRMEILRRVNLLAAPNKVNAVLIEEMLIQ
jgi:flagellar FliL protein